MMRDWSASTKLIIASRHLRDHSRVVRENLADVRRRANDAIARSRAINERVAASAKASQSA